MESLSGLFELTGFGAITWQMLVMWCVVLGMLYLAVFKQFEPLLLVPIAFGALIANLPTKGVIETPPVALHSEVDGVVTKVWVTKRWSNGRLWATNTDPSSRRPRIPDTSSNVGAAATMLAETP